MVVTIACQERPCRLSNRTWLGKTIPLGLNRPTKAFHLSRQVNPLVNPTNQSTKLKLKHHVDQLIDQSTPPKFSGMIGQICEFNYSTPVDLPRKSPSQPSTSLPPPPYIFSQLREKKRKKINPCGRFQKTETS